MHSFLKSPLLIAIFSLALQPQWLLAETSSGSTSATDSKTPAKSADQTGTKTSAKDDSASSDAVAAPQGPALFKLIDTDKDGRISLAEFVAYGKAPEARPTDAGKTSPAGNVRSDSASESTSSKASTKSDAAKTAHAGSQSVTIAEAAPADTGILTSTNTRAGRYTAEVFENLDINHDKFLSQAELDALIPAHQISQP